MGSPQISIIIPHKRGIGNDAALKQNIDMLLANTSCNFELIIDTTCPKDPYMIWNEAARKASAEILVFTNSDVLMAPLWDANFLGCIEYNAILTGYLVEPGNIGVASENIHKDFGKTPSDFQRAAFQDWSNVMMSQVPVVKPERGWYMPCAINRDWFIDTGGFDTTLPFPNPNDILFWNRCIEEYGTRLYRVASFAYHYQNLSGRD